VRLVPRRARGPAAARVGAMASQNAGGITSIESEVARLQRLVGNRAVAGLIGAGRNQRQTDSTGDGPGPGVRNEATFPASLQVLGTLLCFGETTVGGNVQTASLVAKDTIDVGGTVVVTGPLNVQTLSAPTIVKSGGSRRGNTSGSVSRAFDEGEKRPDTASAGTAPTLSRFSTGEETPAPTRGFSSGESTPSSGGAFSTGEAASNGISEGDAPSNANTRDEEPPAPAEPSAFSTLLVRQSLTVVGSMVAGSARLGSPTTIGGSLQVGALRAQTLRAGGTIFIKGPVSGDVKDDAPTVIDNQARAGAGNAGAASGPDDSDNNSD
jgi:hypothetical protein